MTDLRGVRRADDRVRAAIAAVADGRAVVVTDDAHGENEGDLVFAASRATPSLLDFTVRHTSGFLCVAMGEQDCDRLALPPMHHGREDQFASAYRTTVDLARSGAGMSARSRSSTIAALADPATTARDLIRPGHVVPLLAQEGGVLRRAGHPEAAVDLARLAGLPAVGALCEIVSTERPGEMARGEELRRFAASNDFVTIEITDLVAFRRRTEPQVERVAATSLPTAHGLLRVVGYRSIHDEGEHLALVAGDGVDPPAPPDLVAVHVECLVGDVFGSQECSCRESLDAAIKRICARDRGVVVYVRPPGRVRSCAFRGNDDDPATAPGAPRAIADWILDDLVSNATTTTTRPATSCVEEHVPWRRAVPPRSAAG